MFIYILLHQPESAIRSRIKGKEKEICRSDFHTVLFLRYKYKVNNSYQTNLFMMQRSSSPYEISDSAFYLPTGIPF